MSHLWPASWQTIQPNTYLPVLHGKRFNVDDYMLTFQPNSLCMLLVKAPWDFASLQVSHSGFDFG